MPELAGAIIGRLGLALANSRFRLVMLAWATAFISVPFFPDPRGFAIDSHLYESALRNMLEGRPAYLVPDPLATLVSQGRPIYYFPPPPAAIVGGSVNALPGGEFWWLAFNLALLVAGLLVLRRLIGPLPELDGVVGPRGRLALGLAAGIVFEPSLQQLAYGNQQSLMVLGMAGFAFGLLRAKPAVTGLSLAAMILIKGSPALFALPLLAARRWRELGWTAAGAAVGGLVSLAVVGLEPWLDFARALAVGSGLVTGQGFNMAPLPYLLPVVPTLGWVGLAAALMLATGRLEARAMVVTATAVFLLSWPVQWLHYAAIALVPLALLIDDRRSWLFVALAYLLFGFVWPVAWLLACGMLIVAVLRPEMPGQVQAVLRTVIERLAGRSATTSPALLGPPATARPD